MIHSWIRYGFKTFCADKNFSEKFSVNWRDKLIRVSEEDGAFKKILWENWIYLSLSLKSLKQLHDNSPKVFFVCFFLVAYLKDTKFYRLQILWTPNFMDTKFYVLQIFSAY